MTGQDAIALVDTLLHTANQGQGLNDVQSVVFQETWIGTSYREIAKQLGYQVNYIKQLGSQLWR
jgi:DNA-binding CsgD family transcriptional regulator